MASPCENQGYPKQEKQHGNVARSLFKPHVVGGQTWNRASAGQKGGKEQERRDFLLPRATIWDFQCNNSALHLLKLRNSIPHSRSRGRKMKDLLCHTIILYCGLEANWIIGGTKSVCKYHRDTRNPNREHHEQNVPLYSFCCDCWWFGGWLAENRSQIQGWSCHFIKTLYHLISIHRCIKNTPKKKLTGKHILCTKNKVE